MASGLLQNHIQRRSFLKASFQTAAGLIAAPAIISAPQALAKATQTREYRLKMHHIHTGKTFDHVYKVGNTYVNLAELDTFMGDWRTGKTHPIDPALYDLMHEIHATSGSAKPFEIVCGYRCAKTNNNLRSTRGGGIAKDSQHLYGRAVDLYLPGTHLTHIRQAAITCGKGGVGHYPKSGFVHIDTRGYPAQWGARA